MKLARLLLLAVPVVAMACTSLVGLEDVPVPVDATADGTTTGEAGPGGGDATTGEAGPLEGGGGDVATVDAQGDGGSPGDGGTPGDGAGDDGAEAATCTPDASCTPANPCDQGSTDCTSGSAVCVDNGPTSTANGSSCGTGEVCNDGGCVACASGVLCTVTNPCHVGNTSCTTGSSQCVDTGGFVVDGTTCGTGMVCEQGTCTTCAQGSSCVPTTNPCNVGTIDCSTGTPACTDTGKAAADGTACGGGKVCESGTCSTCVTGSACPPANPCHTGTLACATGSSTCNDTGTAVSNGTVCGPSEACKSGACCSTVEICDNGVDDDCDGLVDCADPYCTSSPGGWACTPLPVGNGWTIAAYDSSARPACPASFDATPGDVYSNITGGGATCSCQCGNTSAASCVGDWCWGCWAGSAQCNSANEATCESIYNGTCVLSSADDPIDDFWCEGHPANVATKAGTCSAKTITSKPAVTDSAGETCGLPAVGAGCAAGSVCAPVVPSGFQLCSYNATAPTCPNGLIQSTVYSGFDDTRTCSNTCACGTVDLACNVTGRKYFSQNNCTSSSYNMLTGCTQSPLKDTYAWQVDLSTNGKQTDCAVTTGTTASGAVTPTGGATMCCAP